MTVKLNATGHCWLVALATYEFNIKYRPGKTTINANLLSRNMADEVEKGEWEEIPQTRVKSICQRVCATEAISWEHPRVHP